MRHLAALMKAFYRGWVESLKAHCCLLVRFYIACKDLITCINFFFLLKEQCWVQQLHGWLVFHNPQSFLWASWVLMYTFPPLMTLAGAECWLAWLMPKGSSAEVLPAVLPVGAASDSSRLWVSTVTLTFPLLDCWKDPGLNEPAPPAVYFLAGEKWTPHILSTSETSLTFFLVLLFFFLSHWCILWIFAWDLKVPWHHIFLLLIFLTNNSCQHKSCHFCLIMSWTEPILCFFSHPHLNALVSYKLNICICLLKYIFQGFSYFIKILSNCGIQ